MDTHYAVETSPYALGSYRHTIYARGHDAVASAEHYDYLEHTPHSYATAVSYLHFKFQTLAQYADLLSSGLVVEYFEGEPRYANSSELLEDLKDKHLYTLLTDATDIPQDHPILEKTEYAQQSETLLLNDVFRSVHDALGHGGSGGGFGLRGEERAWIAHRTHYSPEALPALWCETRGQAAWTNAFGDHAQLPLKDRPYADQKATFPSYLYI